MGRVELSRLTISTMDPAACKVVYIDDRFNTERWITREGASTPVTPKHPTQAQADFADLPLDLQSNINAFLTVFIKGKSAAPP